MKMIVISKEDEIISTQDKEVQCELISRYSIDKFILNPKAVSFIYRIQII